jgi:hypothetical protein
MYRREWQCRKCTEHYPCRKVFVGYDGVYADIEDPEELKHCISPFRACGGVIWNLNRLRG